EQAGGDNAAIGPPTDVYALGVILNELVTGQVPFRGNTFGKLVAQIERDPPPLPSGLNPAIDRALEVLILTALEKVPEHRFATGAVFAEALDAYSQGEQDSLVLKYGASLARRGERTGPLLPGENRPPAFFPARTPSTNRPRRSVLAIGMIAFGLLA